MFQRLNLAPPDRPKPVTRGIGCAAQLGGAQRTITFPVDEVTPAGEALPMDRLGNSLELRSARTILLMPEKDRPAISSPRLGRRCDWAGP